ncbi:MAG: PleD family two-component system response regulator [Desertifilum sp. SIO1I2]|nr:PleD family two-component system response regulator [Desertifilum sp. SIO1I2]
MTDSLLPQPSPPLILIADDEKMMRNLLRRAMEKEGYQVVDVTDGESAIAAYQSLQPSVVLLDAIMPGMDGFTCCSKMRSFFEGDRTPILMITALDDPESVDRAFDAGAADYVTKPIHWPVLRQRVKRLLQQVSMFQQLEAANQELQRLASLDGLTGLANRRCFDQVLEKEWRRGVREGWNTTEAPQLSLILCDVDCFKLYNDTYGHQAGDACLQAVAGVLQRVARRPADLVARYGGEEFIVILPNTSQEGAMYVARNILAEMRACEIAHAASVVSDRVTLSLGVSSVVPTSESSQTLLLASADAALYQAKTSGRDRAVFQSPDLSE